MNKPSLTQLYRHGIADDATAKVSALLRDLGPISADLARDLAVLHAPAHERRVHGGRTASVARRRESGWQWGAIAACFIAGIAFFAARGPMSPVNHESALAQSAVSSDQIFNWHSASQVAAHDTPVDDRIFSTDDRTHHDSIFNAGGG